MDNFLHFDSGAIICKPCQYALVPGEIKTHLRIYHQQDLALTKQRIAILCSRILALFPLPELIKDIQVPPNTPPMVTNVSPQLAAGKQALSVTKLSVLKERKN